MERQTKITERPIAINYVEHHSSALTLVAT